MTQDHRHSHAAPSDLPYWASHKIVIYDRFLMAGSDLAFTTVEKLVEYRMAGNRSIILKTLRRETRLLTEFYTNDAVIGGALACLASGQAARYFALATDENGSWLPEVSFGDGIRIPKSASSSPSDQEDPLCDPPRASRYRRSARHIPGSGIDLDA